MFSTRNVTIAWNVFYLRTIRRFFHTAMCKEMMLLAKTSFEKPPRTHRYMSFKYFAVKMIVQANAVNPKSATIANIRITTQH